MAKYIISIDQSAQGTKALLFDETGSIMRRTDRPHRQIINEKGWVSHDPVPARAGSARPGPCRG